MDIQHAQPVAVADLDLAELAHRCAIRDLMYTYACCVDRRDYTLLGEIFAEGGVVEGPEFKMTGIAEIEAAFRMNEQFDSTQHNVFNHRVDISGNSASAETYSVAYDLKFAEDGSSRMDMGIRYLDQLVWREGRWQIAHRKLEVDWLKQAAL